MPTLLIPPTRRKKHRRGYRRHFLSKPRYSKASYTSWMMRRSTPAPLTQSQRTPSASRFERRMRLSPTQRAHSSLEHIRRRTHHPSTPTTRMLSSSTQPSAVTLRYCRPHRPVPHPLRRTQCSGATTKDLGTKGWKNGARSERTAPTPQACRRSASPRRRYTAPRSWPPGGMPAAYPAPRPDTWLPLRRRAVRARFRIFSTMALSLLSGTDSK